MTDLKKQAESLGIEVDGRWSDETLKEKIAEAKAKKSATASASSSAPAPAPTPAPGEARVVPEMGGVRVETAEEVQQTKEGESQPVAPYPADPREAHALAVERSQREGAVARPQDMPSAGTVNATEKAAELYPIRLLYDWWDNQGVRHARDKVVDMPLNEAEKLMKEGKGEYAGTLSPSSR